MTLTLFQGQDTQSGQKHSLLQDRASYVTSLQTYNQDKYLIVFSTKIKIL